MMVRRGFVFTGLVGAVLLLSGCDVFKNYPEYRYRLTVEVETPEGLKSGSSVIAVKMGEAHIRSMGGAGAEARGEAVAVDLPGGRALFALLRSERNNDWASGVMMGTTPQLPPSKDKIARSYDAMIANKAVISLTPSAVKAGNPRSRTGYPMLVTFRDIADPKTVEKVDSDALDKTFGTGVKLKRITVQLTQDAVTTGIEKRLGWLGDNPEPRLDPDYRGSATPNLSQQLWHGDFIKRTSK